MKLCDQCFLGRSVKDTHTPVIPTNCAVVFWFGILHFFSPLCHIHCNIQSISGENSTSANKTWLFLQWLNGMWSSRDFLLFLLHSSQHSAAHVDKTQLLLVIKCTRPTNIEQHKSKQCWMVKQNFPSRAWSTTFQATLLKKEVCEQIKAFLALFSIKFFLTYKPSEAFMVTHNTVKRWAAAQFSEQVTSFH